MENMENLFLMISQRVSSSIENFLIYTNGLAFYLESLVDVVLSLGVVSRETSGAGLQVLQVVSDLLGL